jgi:Tol biopolymer transport system component/DNA-binding winged helix-turn-helix (wHTH) protein
MAYRFDDVEIDGGAFRVTKSGEPVRLEPKAVELLLFLAANPGRLVSKAEVQEAVWKDTAVTENALTRLVAQIRRGLGDDAREARYIETVPTKGYRFIARVDSAGPAPAALPVASADPAPPAGPRWSPALRAAAALSTLIVLVFAFLAIRSLVARPSSVAAVPAPPSVLERQASTGATLNVFPCFSPDGSALAFAALRGRSMELVVRALAPGAREVAVTSDGMQNVQPAFSPDGRRLAYHSVGRGGIWLVPALGGVPRPLTTFGSNPAWSPDGAFVAFQGQSWTGSSEASWSAGEGSTIWLVPAEGGAPRQVTTVDRAGPGGHGGPAWSPTGRLLSFVSGLRAFSVRPDGSDLRQTSRDLWVREVVWERDGRSQMWTGQRSGNWFVWRVTVDPSSGEPTGEPAVLASGGEKAAAWGHPALAPDGKTIAYVTFRTRHEILAQRVTADGRAEGAPLPLVPGIAGRKAPPIFSPDGRRLAFRTVRPGEGQALWMADLESGEVRLLAEQPGLQWSRAWFAGGRRMGYIAPGERGWSIRSVDVETGETREHRVLDDRVVSAPMLSPDGRTLLAHGPRRGALNVWAMDLAGGPARPLTDDTEGIGYPVWSPDGSRIAVEVLRDGNTRVGWLPAAGGAVREIVSAPGQSWPYSFSPDGRRIAFAGQRAGVWNVYWAPVEGGEERRVTDYDSPALYVRYPEWSPRGDRIAYEFAESTSTVWLRELHAPGPP